eukprot:gene15545-21637_t
MHSSLAKFKLGVGSFQSIIEELAAVIEKEREELTIAREKVVVDRTQFEEECKRVLHVLSDSEQVTLNIGGFKYSATVSTLHKAPSPCLFYAMFSAKHSYSTTVSTLRNAPSPSLFTAMFSGQHSLKARYSTTVNTLRNAPSPSLFNAMFSGRHSLKPDASGCYFVDRDGRHFADILNYLRDGQLNYPPDGTDFKYLMELRAEAEFYGLVGYPYNLTGVQRSAPLMLIMYPYNLTRVQRAATLNVEDSWMYEDGQDEVVFTVDRQCQLLGVGLCGTEGGLTVELEVYQVDADDFSTKASTLQTAAQSFKKADGQLVDADDFSTEVDADDFSTEVDADDFSTEVSTLQTAAQSFTKADGQLIKMYLPSPATLVPGKFYMLSALIKGTESYCCEECLDTVIAGGVKVQFQPWESPNGSNEQRGQFPEIYIRVA